MRNEISWKDHMEWELKHRGKENLEHTKKFFKHVLTNYAGITATRTYFNALEIGIGQSGGFIGIMDNIVNKVSLDPIYGDYKDKAESMPFKDYEFDLVIISNALDHCDNPYQVGREITRVLSPKGILFVLNFVGEDEHHPHSFTDLSDVTTLFPDLRLLEQHLCQKVLKRNDFWALTFEK